MARILYAVVAIIVSGLVSFRLIVLGKNIVEPDWPNFFFLAVAFLVSVYGFYILLNTFESAIDMPQLGKQLLNRFS